jgi:nucleoside-diphosphate-sugar epimerase
MMTDQQRSQQALQGHDEPYTATASKRVFCHADDLAEGFIRFMNLTPEDNGLAPVPNW